MNDNIEKSKCRGKKITVKCKNCGKSFEVRVSDVKRGWGKYCSKSCKAKYQEKKTGQYKDYINRNHKHNIHDDADEHEFYTTMYDDYPDWECNYF